MDRSQLGRNGSFLPRVELAVGLEEPKWPHARDLGASCHTEHLGSPPRDFSQHSITQATFPLLIARAFSKEERQVQGLCRPGPGSWPTSLLPQGSHSVTQIQGEGKRAPSLDGGQSLLIVATIFKTIHHNPPCWHNTLTCPTCKTHPSTGTSHLLLLHRQSGVQGTVIAIRTKGS